MKRKIFAFKMNFIQHIRYAKKNTQEEKYMKQIDPKNDIVFTPSNIADLMCTLAGVNENSVVIDSTAGAGALMQAASRAGAKRIIGIEFEDITFKMLSENLGDDKHFTYIQGDGMKYSELIDRPEEINVVLSNPPYSAEDGGMIFADEIMKNMKNGMAVILTNTGMVKETIINLIMIVLSPKR